MVHGSSPAELEGVPLGFQGRTHPFPQAKHLCLSLLETSRHPPPTMLLSLSPNQLVQFLFPKGCVSTSSPDYVCFGLGMFAGSHISSKEVLPQASNAAVKAYPGCRAWSSLSMLTGSLLRARTPLEMEGNDGSIKGQWPRPRLLNSDEHNEEHSWEEPH